MLTTPPVPPVDRKKVKRLPSGIEVPPDDKPVAWRGSRTGKIIRSVHSGMHLSSSHALTIQPCTYHPAMHLPSSHAHGCLTRHYLHIPCILVDLHNADPAIPYSQLEELMTSTNHNVVDGSGRSKLMLDSREVVAEALYIARPVAHSRIE